ncbi:glycosyltransferase family 2 protein [Serratia marcescens]|nr:hypothetical protein SMKC058_08870 [Serratia marcescens]
MNETVILDTRNLETKPTLSVIIPVYNTSLFVTRTLSSFDAVGNKDIEIIIVNDGSTDNSINVVSEWIKNYHGNVALISQENKGLSEARNTALRYARGEYISFCDSDDWLNQKTVLDAVKLAKANGTDVVFYRSFVFDDQNKTAYPFYDSALWDMAMNGVYSKIVDINSYPYLFSLEPNTNNRIISRSFFERHIGEFPSGIHFEDVKPHVVTLANAGKIGLLNSIGYFYRVNRDGKITEQKSEKRFDILKTAKEVMQQDEVIKLNDYQIYCIMSLLVKMIYWCGCNTLLKDRYRFFKEATELFSKKHPQSRAMLSKSLRFAHRNREFILMLSLLNGAASFIRDYSTGDKALLTKVKLLSSMAKSDISANKLIFKKAAQFAKHNVLKRIRNR